MSDEQALIALGIGAIVVGLVVGFRSASATLDTLADPDWIDDLDPATPLLNGGIQRQAQRLRDELDAPDAVQRLIGGAR